MSDAMIGYGAKFAIESGSPATYEDVAEVISITPPSDTIDTVDVTHLRSPDRTREFLAGLRDPGECSFEMNFIPGSDADGALQTVRDAGEVVNCRITFPNDVTW